MRNLEVIPFTYGAARPSDQIDIVALTTASQAYTLPSGAGFIRFSGTVDFYCRWNSTADAVVPTTNITDGTGCELFRASVEPQTRYVVGRTSIQLISPSTAGVLALSVYKP